MIQYQSTNQSILLYTLITRMYRNMNDPITTESKVKDLCLKQYSRQYQNSTCARMVFLFT
ncbi:hypothetical protein QR98_0022650 [Sarcoptes scabiei]|uniref:Uncharacterized protein n=1 Tax=Sarcoptes scabiei TaxID=52283 RepID=A0A132A0F0_SARSC|nr:hypothetical protein QR98_0022650 [Sarcoptes scabiei]